MRTRRSARQQIAAGDETVPILKACQAFAKIDYAKLSRNDRFTSALDSPLPILNHMLRSRISIELSVNFVKLRNLLS
jgi:hypothetical protein